MTVDAIAEAASRILVEGGWAALSMQALATRAGVSPGSLHQYFQRQEGPLMRATLDALAHLGRYEALSRRSAEAAGALRALLAHHQAELPAGLDVDLATHVLANAIHSLTHDGVLRRPEALDDATLLIALRRLVYGYLGLSPAP